MRSIDVEDNLRLRFPERDDHFDDGVEVGMIVSLMAMAMPRINRVVSARVIEQLRSLGARMGYRLMIEDQQADCASIALVSTGIRPTLKLVRNA